MSALTSDAAAPSAGAHMVVSTPGRIAGLLRGGQLSGALLGARLQMLVLDEADLLLSYGYEEDLQLLAPQVGRGGGGGCGLWWGPRVVVAAAAAAVAAAAAAAQGA